MFHLLIVSRLQLREFVSSLVTTADGYFLDRPLGGAPRGWKLSSAARCDPLPAGTGPEALARDPGRARAKLVASLRSMLGQSRPLVVRFEPPPRAPSSPSAPAATPRGPSLAAAWTRYQDPAGRGRWWSGAGGRWFFEESVEWELYRCPVTGAVWKHNEATGAACSA